MKSILLTLLTSAALVAGAPPGSIIPSPASTTLVPQPASTPALRFAERCEGGHAEGRGPGGDFYEAHGPFPTPQLKTAFGEHAAGWGPQGDFYDNHGPFPKSSATTGSIAGSGEPTSTPP
ncbi:hypothetical protein PWT90_09089 [Aphanocladium album]|nr:hypothetical protein PWT90_09089 [Aphanocladium album]